MNSQDLEALAILGEETLELAVEIDLNNIEEIKKELAVEIDLNNIEEIKKELADLLVSISLFNGDNTFNYISSSLKKVETKEFKLHLFNLSKLCFKTIRFGFESYSPFDPDFKSNKKLIDEEINYLLERFSYILNFYKIKEEYIKERIEIKKQKLLNYSFYQKEKLI